MSHIYYWNALFVEPTPGSGERIAAAVFACDEHGDVAVHEIFNTDLLPHGWLRSSIISLRPLIAALKAKVSRRGIDAIGHAEKHVSAGAILSARGKSLDVTAADAARSAATTVSSAIEMLPGTIDNRHNCDVGILFFPSAAVSFLRKVRR